MSDEPFADFDQMYPPFGGLKEPRTMSDAAEIIDVALDEQTKAAKTGNFNYLQGKDVIEALHAAGKVIVDREPSDEQIAKGREQMPVEVDYWQENGFLHAKMRDLKDCVSPAKVYRAMTSQTGE